ncbi:MAG TPA: flagellum biosynthesis protein FlbT [Rhodospirillales bacterium]|nr:flagellum biosynthesis protein FlbT [Rhodospirillales bacterium]
MPLKIQLKKGQKVIINGAVLENATSRTASLLVINDAAIMRDSDILTPEEATTPASRIYYSLQCLYLFPEKEKSYLPRFYEFISSYLKAAPSSQSIMDKLRKLVDNGELYQALRLGQKLIAHEREVLSHVQEKLDEELRDAAPGGKSPGG